MVKIGKRLKNLRTAKNLAQWQMAEKINVHQAMISKWESDKEMPGVENMNKLANFFEMTIPDLMGVAVATQTGGRRVSVVGEVAAGDWVESIEWPEDDHYQVPAMLPDSWDGVPISGFVVRGRSMNKIYPDSALVFVAPLEYVANSPEDGQVVLAIRQDAAGNYERTLKEYVVDAGKAYLWPRSDDPEHQTPLQFKKSGRDPESVHIAGVVIAHFAMAPSLRRAR